MHRAFPAPAHREKKVEGESNLCFTSYTFYLRVINPLCFGGGARTYRLLYSDDTFSCWRQPIEHDDLVINEWRCVQGDHVAAQILYPSHASRSWLT